MRNAQAVLFRLATAALGAVVICALVGISANAGQSSSPAVHILSCAIGSGGYVSGRNAHRAVLEIRFRNDSNQNVSSLTWRARYGSGWIDFTDAGNFAPGVAVKHDLHVDLTEISQQYYAEGIENCSLIATRTSDGAEWKNPDVDPQTARIPTPRPDNAAAVPETYDNPIRDPIGIIGCSIGVRAGHARGLGYKLGVGALEARVRNLSDKPIDRIVLRAAYLSGGFDFIFGRNFAPGVLVKSDVHSFGVRATSLIRDLPLETPVDYASLDEPANCITVTAHFTNGTTWQNPSVSPSEPPLPTAPPTAPPN